MPDCTDRETNDKLGLYSGEAGLRYHLQREGSRTEDGQRRRARYFADVTKPSDVVLDAERGPSSSIFPRLVELELRSTSLLPLRQEDALMRSIRLWATCLNLV